MSIKSQRFASTVKSLLSGNMICEFSNPDGADYLRHEKSRSEVNEYLGLLGYRVMTTRGDHGFFLGHLDLDQDDAQQDCRTVLNGAMDFRLLIDWLMLEKSTSVSGEPLTYGREVSEGQWLSAVERTPVIREGLDRICSQWGSKAGPEDPGKQIKFVFRKLVETGYLVKKGAGQETVYRASARWTRLYELLERINQNEGILSHENDQQENHQEAQSELAL